MHFRNAANTKINHKQFFLKYKIILTAVQTETVAYEAVYSNDVFTQSSKRPANFQQP